MKRRTRIVWLDGRAVMLYAFNLFGRGIVWVAEA